ncbi:MAG: hypothetical protein R3F48_12055 [Candidatus Zixiibacteriota bacterium]
MNTADEKRFRNQRLFLFAAVIAVIIGVFLRLYAPDLDPPRAIGENSQALVTDPSHIVYHAANYIRFGESDPFSYKYWKVFQISLMSAVAYFVFAIAGVTPLALNIIGTIPPIVGIVLLAFGCLARNKSPYRYGGAFVVCLLLCINFTLITYNREPFLESALLFYFGLLFFLYQRFGLRRSNLVTMAVIISLACITGKIFAVVFYVVVGAMILLDRGSLSERLKLFGFFAGSAACSLILFLFVLVGYDVGSYAAFLKEHIAIAETGSLEIPAGYRYFTHFFTFGTKSHLFSLSPFLFSALYMALIFYAIRLRNGLSFFRENGSLVFALLCFAGYFVFFDQSLYTPLRYQVLLLSPAVVILALFLSADASGLNNTPSAKRSVISTLLIFLISWFAWNQLFMESLYRSEGSTAYVKSILISAIIALIIAILLGTRKLTKRLVAQSHLIRKIVFILILMSGAYQFYGFVSWINAGEYHLRDASQDIAEIVGSDAVFTGSFAGAVTLTTGHKYFIYFSGLEMPDMSDIDITHLALEYNEISRAQKKLGVENLTTTIAQYKIRGIYYSILRVLPTRNRSHSSYQPTAYELANAAIDSGYYDSALVYNEAFLAEHPNNRSALMQRYMIYENLKGTENLENMLEDIRHRFTDDEIVRLFYEQKLSTLRGK